MGRTPGAAAVIDAAHVLQQPPFVTIMRSLCACWHAYCAQYGLTADPWLAYTTGENPWVTPHHILQFFFHIMDVLRHTAVALGGGQPIVSAPKVRFSAPYLDPAGAVGPDPEICIFPAEDPYTLVQYLNFAVASRVPVNSQYLTLRAIIQSAYVWYLLESTRVTLVAGCASAPLACHYAAYPAWTSHRWISLTRATPCINMEPSFLSAAGAFLASILSALGQRLMCYV